MEIKSSTKQKEQTYRWDMKLTPFGTLTATGVEVTIRIWRRMKVQLRNNFGSVQF